MSAHVILDAVTAFEPGRAGSDAAMELALQRLTDIEGSISATYDDERAEVTLNATGLLGGTVSLVHAIAVEIARLRGVSVESVVADLRGGLDAG